ncbi:MAG: hypothetical protein ACHQ01_01605 [Candidatus Limnocylindrales bacterium]
MNPEPESPNLPDETAILPEVKAEAERLSRLAMSEGIAMRLMGGVAIWLRSESVRKPPFAREYADMDFAVSSKARAQVKAFLDREGYVPEKLFNAIHGAQRLNYAEPKGRWTMDILIDELSMSHRLDLRGRLDGLEPTLALADLVLTKLQIWEINRKDVGDVLCLLADHPLGKDGDGEIGLDRIAAVLGADWGFCHTAERNLAKVSELWAAEPAADARYDVASQVEQMTAAIAAAPKSLAWKTRARVGERLRWYETPEEVRH